MLKKKRSSAPDPPDRGRRSFVKAIGSGVAIAALSPLPATSLVRTGVVERIELDLRHPRGLACATDGTYWLCEAGRYRVVRLDPRGAPLTAFGGPGSGQGRFNWPGALRIDQAGRLWIVDTNNGRVTVHNTDGRFVGQYGSLGGTPGKLFNPEGLALDAGRLIVANTRGHNVQLFDQSSGEVIAALGVLGEDPQPSGPQGLDYGLRLPTAVAARDSGLLVLDSKHGRVLELDSEGRFGFTFGNQGSGAGELNMPQDMLAGPDGLLIVADTGNARLTAFRHGGPLPAIEIELRRPIALSRHADGRLAVLDAAGPTIVLVEGI
ncbi:MAG: NHL repeat-containing protein [Candidatus Alcyoniella australis]|nr:NHL repeat-containing protein [Candidatus Alcyoniella australis]